MQQASPRIFHPPATGLSTRLNTLVAHHRRTAEPERSENIRCVEVEHPEQLQRGVKVYHPTRGVGIVLGCIGRGSHLRVRVRFPTSEIAHLAVQGGDLQLVID